MSSSKREKSRRHKYDEDYAAREVSKAMKQMEKAMQQARMAEKMTRQAYKATKHAQEGVNYTPAVDGAIQVVNKTINVPGNLVMLNNCQNIQVGTRNHMVINKARNPSSGRKKEFAATGDEEDFMMDRRTAPEPLSEEAQKRLQAVMESTSPVTESVMNVISQNIGREWRRVLRSLDIQDELIEELFHDYHLEGIRQVIFAGLKKWGQLKGPQATVGALAKVLKKTEHMDALNCLQTEVLQDT